MNSGKRWRGKSLCMIKAVETQTQVTAGIKKIVISDTDFLSSFLWRKQFGIVIKVFARMGMDIVVPQAVMEELEYSVRTRERLAGDIRRENERKDKQQGSGSVYIREIEAFSDEGLCFGELRKTIGKGEAAAISMVLYAEDEMACLASNNLQDISDYVKENEIELWTTADVLMKAVEFEIITERAVNRLWKKMCEDGMWMPEDTYEDYISKQKKVV